jgi:hypothetical protein
MKPLEKLIHETDTDDSHISERIVRGPAKAELKRLRNVEAAAIDLIEIVEGIRGDRWAFNGFRLKDTPEWCVFYAALAQARAQGGAK